jgi:putative protease
MGVDACKVVGRVLPVERIESEIKLIKENIDIAKKCISEDDYLSKVVRPEYVDCKSSDNCFYVNTRYLLK